MNIYQKLKTEEYWEELNFNRFGITACCIFLQTCLGSIAAASCLTINSMVGLALVTITNLLSNSLIISQRPLKGILISSVITLSISIGAIIYVLLIS
ncbi:MAG: hypothetical protein COB15_01305 [Flavobacteriales bacterium]|nr:MAG: hypothetical protein COB15_01305 [Flavobacteriales bacterium]